MQHCFRHLVAPVHTQGALDLPAVPIAVGREAAMLSGVEKVAERLGCY